MKKSHLMLLLTVLGVVGTYLGAAISWRSSQAEDKPAPAPAPLASSTTDDTVDLEGNKFKGPVIVAPGGKVGPVENGPAAPAGTNDRTTSTIISGSEFQSEVIIAPGGSVSK